MTAVRDMDKAAGKCDQCGRIAVVAISDSGSHMIGNTDCPNCGSSDFSLLEYSGED